MTAWRSIRVEANSEFADLSIRKLFERYSRGSFSLSTTLKAFKQTPAAIEPGIGGRLIEQSELRPGDIILATTVTPGAHGIPFPGLVSRAIICRDSQQIIDSTSETFVDTTVANLLATSPTVAVFRIQVGKDSDADQRQVGERLATEASAKIGAAMSVLDGDLDRPSWVQIPRAYFGLDRFVFKQTHPWVGLVNMDVAWLESRFFPFYCSWLFLDTVCTVGKASDKESLRFWFTVDNYWKAQEFQGPLGEKFKIIVARLEAVGIFQPLGYVGHLKSPN